MKTNNDVRMVAVSVTYQDADWRYVLASMAFYFLEPVVMPIMLLASKILRRKIDWFPVVVSIGTEEHDVQRAGEEPI